VKAVGGLGGAVASAIALVLSAANPASAQDASASATGGSTSSQARADARTRELLENAREAYAIPKKASRCEEAAVGNEIVVCAHDDDDRFRAEGNVDSTDTGVPHADVGHHPPPGGVTARGCFLQKCPKEVYLIDLSKIPMPPPGSDADKIAKGEMAAP
jgi:hypothetical protein